ncbi:MAG TPA: hypothetical protein VGH38_37475 [Bryobacteraceae bacterium]|jgi:hypothetical protein
MRLLLCLVCAGLAAQTLPKIPAENLAGEKVELPTIAAGKAAILVVGFTHASQSQTKAWSARLAQEFPEQSGVAVYSLAVLEDVPKLVRGMAVHGIKSGVPNAQRQRFLLVYHNEAELKRAAAFDRPDDAYLLLLDPAGAVRWSFHGAVSDSAIAEVQKQVHALDQK